MKIAILGAGIGGLAAASLLRQFGDITVFDQFSKPTPVGSGLIIQPVGQRVLDELGVLETCLTYGQPLYQMLGRRVNDQRAVLDVCYGEVGGNNFGLSIHRAGLFDALFNKAQKAGVDFKLGHKFKELSEQKNGVEIKFEQYAFEECFDLVIDAMGARSPLSPISTRALDYGALWATVDWLGDIEEDILHQRYQKAHRMIGLMPLGRMPSSPQRKTALFWSLPKAQFDDFKNVPISHWHEAALALWPEAERYIKQISSWDQFTCARYCHGTLRRPYWGRIIHIGDAAHQASPQLGQGANMALLDALALARAFTEDATNIAQQYWRTRRRHILIYQTLSALFTPLYQSNSNSLPWIRDNILASTSQWPIIRGSLQELVKGSLVRPISNSSTLGI